MGKKKAKRGRIKQKKMTMGKKELKRYAVSCTIHMPNGPDICLGVAHKAEGTFCNYVRARNPKEAAIQAMLKHITWVWPHKLLRMIGKDRWRSNVVAAFHTRLRDYHANDDERKIFSLYDLVIEVLNRDKGD